MQEGRGSRDQGESVRRWLEERQAERAQRAARSSVPAGEAGAPRQEDAAYEPYDRPYDSYNAPAGSGVDEHAPGEYGRSTRGTTWEPTPSPSRDAGEPVPPVATKPRRRRFGWWKRIALVVLVLIAAVVGL